MAVKPKPTTIATRPSDTPMPAFMKGKAGKGTERVTSADVEIPRLKLLQALSPEVQEGDHKQGEFFHTVAEVSLGSNLLVVPIYVDISYILWRPREMGGGILARAQDGIHWNPPNGVFEIKLKGKKETVTWRTAKTVSQSGLAEWGSSDPSDPNSQPAATRMYNVVVMMPKHMDYSPAVVTLQRAAIKVARKFMGKLKIAQAPCYGLQFMMSSMKDSSPGGEFWNYKFTGEGFVPEPRDFEQYEGMYERFRAEGLKIRDIEGLQSDEVPTEAVGDKM